MSGLQGLKLRGSGIRAKGFQRLGLQGLGMIGAKGFQRIRVLGCEELRSDRLGLSLDLQGSISLPRGFQEVYRLCWGCLLSFMSAF